MEGPGESQTLPKVTKSQSLYNYLTKKKKVGCLPMKATESFEVAMIKKSCESSHSLKEELHSHSDREDQHASHSKEVTNVSLCCAITQSTSSTPVHTLSHSNNVNLQIDYVPKGMLASQDDFELKSPTPKNRLHSLLKTVSSETNLMARFGSAKKMSSRKPRSAKRSVSLTRGVFPTSDKEATHSKEADFDSSVENTPRGSPVFSRASIRRRLFFSADRRSMEAVPSSSNSSPASVRSLRTSDGKLKKKNRPFSLAVMDGSESPKIKSRTNSTDSLALQSLFAAQVLHIIPVEKAKERNFLHGRIATNSLLGNIELSRVLPSKEVTIYVASWNMNGQAPPGGMEGLLLPDSMTSLPDIVAVGTQESHPERFNWEVTLQETLGPSHVLYHSAALGTIHLAIFLRRDLIWFCSLGDEASYSVRPGTAFRTKGAVGIAFYLFGSSFLFLTCHLTAHQDKIKERISDIKRIVRSLELPKILPSRYKAKDVTDNFDNVLWFGDLNFRVDCPREEVVDWVSKQSFPITETSQLLLTDQLTNIISEGSVLKGFKEGKVNFPPTYKFDPGSQNYDTSSKQRIPSYTDRILYKSTRREEQLECLDYSSVADVCTSDHKPVWALFKTRIRPGMDTIPLAAGLFNREVYLEAIKRRAATLDYREDVSTICSIQ